MIIKRICQYLFMVLLCMGCVRHTLRIQMSPDGDYTFTYQGNGTRDDLLDHDMSVPQGMDWVIHSTIDSVDADTHDYTAQQQFSSNVDIPATFYTEDSLSAKALLSHPIEVSYRNWFFRKTYHIEATIGGRSVDDKYPLFASMIKDPDHPASGWMREAFAYLLQETLNQSEIGFNQKGMLQTDLTGWLNETISPLDDSTLIAQFDDLKEEGLDIIMYGLCSAYAPHPNVTRW